MTKTAESKWRALIRAQEKSGQGVREFARSKGINATTLYWWRSELRRRRSELVPVEVVEQEPKCERSHGLAPGFELVLGDGLRIRVPHGFDRAELRRLVSALQC